MDDALGHGARLVAGERNRGRAFDVDQELAVEDEKDRCDLNPTVIVALP